MPLLAYRWVESGPPALASLLIHTLHTHKGASTPTLVQIMCLRSCMDPARVGLADLGTLCGSEGLRALCSDVKPSVWKEQWAVLE